MNRFDVKEGFYYMLAPIEDMTDSSFRTICWNNGTGADLTFTELSRLESLAKRNACTLEKIKLYDETPTMIQLAGQKEMSLKRLLSGFVPNKGFRGFNLNLGCPVPDFVGQGIGCAMVKRISKTRKLVDIIKDHGYGVSIKMRLGLNRFEKEKKVYLNLINSVDADFFIVHARHGKETYIDKADRSVFPECVKTGKPIIANGDIRTSDDVRKMKDFGCKGIMIGRAATVNPLIFTELKGLPLPRMDRLRAEYEKLLKERNAANKYPKNIFKHLGKTDSEYGDMG